MLHKEWVYVDISSFLNPLGFLTYSKKNTE